MHGIPLGAADSPWVIPLALGAGFLDGLNPCAITVLILFVGALLTTVGSAVAGGHAQVARLRIWTVAGGYITGVFLLYLLLGLGFLQFAWLAPLSRGHLATRVAGVGAVILGLAMAAEYFYPEGPVRVRTPDSLHGLVRRWTRPASGGAAFVAGVLIGLCTIPCGGGLYLAVGGVLALLENRAGALVLLLVYNVGFVLPLVLVVLAATSRAALLRISRWHVRSREALRLALGLLVTATGLLALALA
ncbi:cytochrome c biogenesis CcdA family protein [Caldinitratiruptor microaerophilus]|uniref:Cytochrome C biogenesis protein transmembrane domain-containing protein n=1 Tax=Caldinitratiruptor microaerophilus TaxID=671077 RepID=A0AA35CKZ9_9FIRM|nr:cytochrome c biogenesis protein CcdA [Caldinitratiruptor microaerophilus]BDG61142.1 hypothetical protein caldi_22320 [Caldinitratiruptor microaerophilus]